MPEHEFNRLVKKTRVGVGGLNNSFRCKSCLSTCCSNSRVKRAYSELMSWRKLLFVKEYILSDNNGFKYTSITVWKVWNAIKKQTIGITMSFILWNAEGFHWLKARWRWHGVARAKQRMWNLLSLHKLRWCSDEGTGIRKL